MLRFLKLSFLTVIVIIPLITLAVANRHAVSLILDPFSPKNPALAVDLPFFVYLFGALFLGLLLGGFATWLGQGKWRRRARQRTREAYEWRVEADRLTRQLETSQNTRLPMAS